MSFSVMAYVIAFSFGLVLSGRAIWRRDWEGLGVWVVLMMGGLIGMGCWLESWDAFVMWSNV